MTSFKVYLNGKEVCTAGMPHTNGVVTNILTWIKREHEEKEELYFQVSGLNSDKDESYTWLHTDMKHDDEILIRITNDSDISVISKIATKKEVAQRSLEQKIKYFHKLREELKDHLNQ